MRTLSLASKGCVERVSRSRVVGGTLASPRLNSSSVHVAPIVYVVEDDISVCNSLSRIIRGAGWEPSIWPSGEEFLARPRVLSPCCLLVEVNLPGLSGFDIQARVVERREMPVIFMTEQGDVATVVRAMKAGALDFLMKPFSEVVLRSAVLRALERSQDALCREVEREALSSRYASLSLRQREVMGLVIAGRLNKQVAGALGIAEVTVKAHRGCVMRKMGAHSLAELVNFGARLGAAV